MKPQTQAEPQKSTDKDIVRLAQHGDAAAFEQVYRLHSPKVYALCLRMTGDPTEAEDLTQDVFLQLFRKIGTFRGESAFSTWLHRMSVNIVLMRFRRKPVVETSVDAIASSEEEFSTAPMEFGRHDLGLIGAIDRLTLQDAIKELAPGHRAMFILHYVQGYQHNEIARIFRCSVGNSKSQVHKARVRLRELLKQSVGGRAYRNNKSIAGSLAVHRRKYTFEYANA